MSEHKYLTAEEIALIGKRVEESRGTEAIFGSYYRRDVGRVKADLDALRAELKQVVESAKEMATNCNLQNSEQISTVGGAVGAMRMVDSEYRDVLKRYLERETELKAAQDDNAKLRTYYDATSYAAGFGYPETNLNGIESDRLAVVGRISDLQAKADELKAAQRERNAAAASLSDSKGIVRLRNRAR